MDDWSTNDNGKNYARIMVIGKSGTGKSSFLNYLTSEQHFRISDSIPCTQDFDAAVYESVDGIPLEVYDSKGLEVLDFSTIQKRMLDFIESRCSSDNPMNWIHSIFYCINVKSARIENSEFNLIRSINENVSQTVHFILTHCDSPDDEKAVAMENYVKEVLSQSDNCNFSFIRVNSVDTHTRAKTVPAFGRKEALDSIFTMLWSDMAHKVAKDYAKEYVWSMYDFYFLTTDMVKQVKKKITTPFLIKCLKNDGVDDVFDKTMEPITEVWEAEINRIDRVLNAKYTAIINPLADFYNAYNRQFGKQYEVSPFDEYSSFDFDNIDMDNILEHTKLGKIMSKMDEMELDSFGDFAKGLAIASHVVLRIHSLFGEIFDQLIVEMWNSIPSTYEVENAIYPKLMARLTQKD